MNWLAEIVTYQTEVTTSEAAGFIALFSGIWLFFWLVFLVAMIAAYWKLFEKAGEDGWKSIIPIYNTVILLKIVGRPAWWVLLLLIPFVNIVILILVALDLAKSFGKSEVFGIVALVLFSVIGYLILGFGGDKYVGPAAAPKQS